MEAWLIGLFALAVLSNGLYFLNKIATQLIELNEYAVERKVEERLKEIKEAEEKAAKEKK